MKMEADKKNKENSELPLGEKRDVTYKVVGRAGYRQIRPIPLVPGGPAHLGRDQFTGMAHTGENVPRPAAPGSRRSAMSRSAAAAASTSFGAPTQQSARRRGPRAAPTAAPTAAPLTSTPTAAAAATSAHPRTLRGGLVGPTMASRSNKRRRTDVDGMEGVSEDEEECELNDQQLDILAAMGVGNRSTVHQISSAGTPQ